MIAVLRFVEPCSGGAPISKSLVDRRMPGSGRRPALLGRLLRSRWDGFLTTRFDVNQHVLDAREFRLQPFLHLVRQRMGTGHGHLRIHVDVQIHEIPVAVTADDALLNKRDFPDRSSSARDALAQFLGRGRIHEVVQRHLKTCESCKEEYRLLEACIGVIRGLEAPAVPPRALRKIVENLSDPGGGATFPGTLLGPDLERGLDTP